MPQAKDARELIAWLIARGYLKAEEAEFAMVCLMGDLNDD